MKVISKIAVVQSSTMNNTSEVADEYFWVSSHSLAKGVRDVVETNWSLFLKESKLIRIFSVAFETYFDYC